MRWTHLLGNHAYWKSNLLRQWRLFSHENPHKVIVLQDWNKAHGIQMPPLYPTCCKANLKRNWSLRKSGRIKLEFVHGWSCSHHFRGIIGCPLHTVWVGDLVSDLKWIHPETTWLKAKMHKKIQKGYCSPDLEPEDLRVSKCLDLLPQHNNFPKNCLNNQCPQGQTCIIS